MMLSNLSRYGMQHCGNVVSGTNTKLDYQAMEGLQSEAKVLPFLRVRGQRYGVMFSTGAPACKLCSSTLESCKLLRSFN